MANPPPAPVQKKSGLGCLGCGCLILVLLAILFLALVGGTGYWVYTEAVALTSPTPSTLQSFDGGDDVYNRAKQKVTDFDHDLNNHQAATIDLTADEINTLIARNPFLTENKIHLFVTLNNDQARVQASTPTGIISGNLIKDRYLNGDTSFGVNFNADDKTLNLDLKNLQVGDREMPKNSLPMLQNEINQIFNQLVQKNSEDSGFKLLLNHAKSIEIKDSELVIETQ